MSYLGVHIPRKKVIPGSTYLLGNKYWGVHFEGSSFLLRHRGYQKTPGKDS